MVSFTSNKIVLDLEAVSEQLKNARLEKRLRISDAARALNISAAYLEHMENNRFHKLPAGVYGKNFLREYALFLDLDHAELISILEKEQNAPVEKNKIFSNQIIRGAEFFALPKLIKGLVISTVVISCFIYLGYRLEKITAPPELVINTPEQNIITEEKKINISGMTEAETNIMINGELALSDNEGKFSKEINLRSGMNVITIVAKKKHGKENIITRQILVREEKL